MFAASWLLLSATLWHQAFATSISSQSIAGSEPKAITVESSQEWTGDDGPWGTFVFQVGNKPQQVHLLPSTYFSFPMLISEKGCNPDLGNDTDSGWPFTPSTCEQSRGGIFRCQNSPSCVEPKIGLDLRPFQMVTGLGFENLTTDVSSDQISLGWQGSGHAIVPNVMFGELADFNYSWIGLLGLDARPTNISGYQPSASLIQSLKNQSVIPSLSYSYTAGAYYRPGDFGSLTLGGIDLARSSSPSLDQSEWWSFYGDDETPLSVMVSSIVYRENNTVSGTATTTGHKIKPKTDIMATVDSSRPYLLFPQDVCNQIADAFGIAWDDDFHHYLINETQHEVLSQRGLSLDIQVTSTNPADSRNNTKVPFRVISLPYNALSLELKYPQYPSNSKTKMRYLPIAAAPAGKYVLGRALLQEALISTDYERKKFLLEPQKYTGLSNVSSIYPVDHVEPTSGLSTAMVAGIVVLAVVVLAGLVLTILLCRRRKRSKQARAEEAAIAAAKEESLITPSKQYGFELDDNTKQPVPIIHEMTTDGIFADGTTGNAVEIDSLKYIGDRDSRPVIRIYYEMDATPASPATEPARQTDTKLAPGTTSQGSTISSTNTEVTGNTSSGISSLDSTNGAAGVPRLVNIPPSRLGPAWAPPKPMFSQAVPGSGRNPGDRTPASPIPPTPLEFYGGFGRDGRPIAAQNTAMNNPSDLRREVQQRNWVGRAPGLPVVTFTPATPQISEEAEVDDAQAAAPEPNRI